MNFKISKRISILLAAFFLSGVFYSCGPGLESFDLLPAPAVVPPVVPSGTLTLSPANGAVGTLVTITGEDFSTLQTVTIGGVAAIPINYSSTTLTAMVMPGAATGLATVVTAGGSYDSTSSFTITATGIPATQQGTKLVGTGAVGHAYQGLSIAISADGNTALVGGWHDNTDFGAAWVFTRSAGTWSQQGTKLVGTGAVGAFPLQGFSVALSADGNTAVIGGHRDNSDVGAAWVFTRSAGVWSQQGSKLVGTGAVANARQGSAVALSADGNTALVAGCFDNTSIGATWVFTRSAGVWSQQGSKLVGTGNIGNAQQGFSVSLSADGNTALIGGHYDNSEVGASWIFIRSAGIWSQEGAKLTASDSAGALSDQGSSVSLSADGNTALVGGLKDNSNVGAAWIYTRSAGAWTQQGSKLVGTGTSGTSTQGSGVSLSADGNTAVIGGNGDNGSTGAIWIFTRSGGSWLQQGGKLVGTGVSGAVGNSVALSADGKTAAIGAPNDSATTGASLILVP